MKHLALAIFTALVVLSEVAFGLGLPTKEALKTTTMKYVADTYKVGQVAPLYRTIVFKCNAPHASVYYYHAVTKQELYIEDTTGWEDHVKMVYSVFGLEVEVEKLRVMQLATQVLNCPASQEKLLKQGALRLVQMYMIQPVTANWVQGAHDKHKEISPEYKWHLTLIFECGTENDWTAIIEDKDGNQAIFPGVETPRELFKQASVIWPDVENWYALKNVGSQVQIPAHEYCLQS